MRQAKSEGLHSQNTGVSPGFPWGEGMGSLAFSSRTVRLVDMASKARSPTWIAPGVCRQRVKWQVALSFQQVYILV